MLLLHLFNASEVKKKLYYYLKNNLKIIYPSAHCRLKIYT